MPRFLTKPHDGAGPFRENGEGTGPELESLETTRSEAGGVAYYCTGYGARQIAEARRKRLGGTVYVNSVSRRIVQKDLRSTVSAHVAYAVAEEPIYTLIREGGAIVRAYWPSLED